MVDKEPQIKKLYRGRYFGGPVNVLKTLGRRIGLPFHYYRTEELELPVTKRLRQMGLIKLLTSRLDELNQVEEHFGKITDEILPEVNKIYTELGGYTTLEVIEHDLKFATKGTTENAEKGEENTIKIDDFDVTFHIPKATTIMLPAKFVLGNARYFGCDNSTWVDEYTQKIDEICDKLKNKYKDEKNKVKRIEIIRDVYKEIVMVLMTGGIKEPPDGFTEAEEYETIYRKEKRLESLFSDLRAKLNRVRELRKEVMSRTPAGSFPENIKYKHTYKVIRPVVYNLDGTAKATLSNWEMRSGEKGPGLDENGMPLEVDYDNKVLIDKWDKENGVTSAEPRPVPEEFIEELSLLEVVGYVAADWDAFRDDLRDGRWHPKSLTIMKYLMARNRALGSEWKKKWEVGSEENLVSPDDREYKMEIGGEKEKIKNEMEPSEYNPAFDMRAISEEFKKGFKWQHIGRRYYYTTTFGIHKEEQKDPMISTRGLSMYIIDRICREGKSLKEIKEDLVVIGKETGGYDFGPRPFGGYETFCKNPLRIDVDAVLKSIVPPPKAPPKEE